MANVKIYVTDSCPYCFRAKELLTRKGIRFEEIDVTGDPKTRAWLAGETGRRTVPQVFINDSPSGGCDDLYALEASGELDQLLAG